MEDEKSGPIPRALDYQMSERISRLEWAHEELGKRLSQGAEAFSDLRDSIGTVRADLTKAHEKFQEAIAPKPTPWWRVAGVIITVCLIIGGWIWQMAKYPDRSEFEKFQHEAQGAQKSIDEDVRLLREKQHEFSTEQRLLSDSVKRSETSMQRIDEKLDRLVNRR
jgi:predicted  nucleic acid-binding Zn-ribbon protein